MRRLARAGFRKPFVREVILPDWWDTSCDQDPDLLPDVELRVARFLGAPLDSVRTPGSTLTSPHYPNANLRRVKTLDPLNLVPAVHVGMQIAAAAVRSFVGASSPIRLPQNATTWRQEILQRGCQVVLPAMVEDLWSRGIPVLHVEVLPSPRFQGMACVVGDRPVILLGHGYDAPSKLAFYVAHEMGHIVAGDCKPDAPVVEETDEPDNSSIEMAADRFARLAFAGVDYPPQLRGTTPEAVAQHAHEIENSKQIEAGFLINTWAMAKQDFAVAQLALKALWREHGGRLILRSATEQHLQFDEASESDRQLLRCLYGEPDRDEAGRRH